MKVLSEMALYWDRTITYLEICSSRPWRAAACRPLWGWLSVGSITVGTLILLWAGWKLIAYWFQYDAERRGARYRRRVETDEMLRIDSWTGNDKFPQRPTEAEFYARLEEGLKRRKLQERGEIPPRSTL